MFILIFTATFLISFITVFLLYIAGLSFGFFVEESKTYRFLYRYKKWGPPGKNIVERMNNIVVAWIWFVFVLLIAPFILIFSSSFIWGIGVGRKISGKPEVDIAG